MTWAASVIGVEGARHACIPSLRSTLGWLAVLIGAGSFASEARAFSAPSVYAGPAANGGGGGRWFTGSPAEGFGCSACHTGNPGQPVYPLGITGVPFKGYTPGQTYAVVLDWPEFARRWRAVRPDPSVKPVVGEAPAVGILAEFVPENGQASGTVEILASVLQGPELCEQTRPNAKVRLGASLFQVRPGVKPIEIEPNEDGLMRCEAQRLGQRCIVAVASCGAHQVQLRWTPPDTLAPGPIWFSAGMVATDFLSGTPEGDSVYEFSAPLVSDDSPSQSYEAVLEGAPCTVTRVGTGGSRRSRLPLLAFAFGLSVLLMRRRPGGPNA